MSTVGAVYGSEGAGREGIPFHRGTCESPRPFMYFPESPGGVEIREKVVDPSMSLEDAITAAFRMNDQTWRCHANPWSGWTRVPILPLLVFAIWSRVWIGWGVLLPIAGLILWTGVNPHAFSPPASTDNWMSKGVLGERVWLNRDQIPVPEHHRGVPTLLSVLSGSGLVPVGWGLYSLSVWPTVLGTVLAVGAKMWFLDRMVWLYEDRKETAAYDRWMGLREA